MKELNLSETFHIHGASLSNSEAIVFTTLAGGLIGTAMGTYAYNTANTGLGAAIFSGLGIGIGQAILYAGLGSVVVTLGASVVTVSGKAAWNYFIA